MRSVKKFNRFSFHSIFIAFNWDRAMVNDTAMPANVIKLYGKQQAVLKKIIFHLCCFTHLRKNYQDGSTIRPAIYDILVNGEKTIILIERYSPNHLNKKVTMNESVARYVVLAIFKKNTLKRFALCLLEDKLITLALRNFFWHKALHFLRLVS